MRNDVIKRLAAANPVPRAPARVADVRSRRLLTAVAAVVAASIGVVFLAQSGSHRNGASPIGPRGPVANGPTGSRGPSGIAGAEGPTGFTGPTGSQGPSGAEGVVWNPIALGDTSAALGAPVFLPDAPPVAPADTARATATAQCGGPPASKCVVVVTYPTLGLRVHYSRLTYHDPLSVYQADVQAGSGDFRIDYIAGVPVLVEPGYVTPESEWSSFVEFVVGGTTVGLVGDFDVSTLEALGKSIIDQANAS